MSRRRIEKILAVVSYFSGFDAVCRFLTRGRKRVIMYHNVLPESLMRKDVANSFTTSEAEFRRDIRYFKGKYGISNDMNDAERVAISFDDGFKSQGEIAGRIMESEGDLPAMIFCAGGVLDSTSSANTLAVERVLHWVSNAPDEAIAMIGVDTREEAWPKVLWPRFRGDWREKGEGVCRWLDGIYPFAKVIASLPAEYVRLRLTGLTREELDALRRKGWLVCWHTQSHFPLKMLPEEEQKREMAPPDEMRELPFAYPYGDAGCVGGETIRLAQDLGFKVAFASCPQKQDNPYFISRYATSEGRIMFHYHFSGARFAIRRMLKALGIVKVV